MIVFPISLYWYDQPKLTLSTRWCSEQWFLVPTLSSSFNNKIIELQAIKARVDQDSHM